MESEKKIDVFLDLSQSDHLEYQYSKISGNSDIRLSEKLTHLTRFLGPEYKLHFINEPLLTLSKETSNARPLSFGILIGRLTARLAKVDPNILSFWNC
jgi:hypothetical protein